jgi:hypothetical protein
VGLGLSGRQVRVYLATLKWCDKIAIKRALSRVAKRSVWICSCGYTVPKKGAVLSGENSYSQGFHVHCPNCGRVIAQFVDPKRVGH